MIKKLHDLKAVVVNLNLVESTSEKYCQKKIVRTLNKAPKRYNEQKKKR